MFVIKVSAVQLGNEQLASITSYPHLSTEENFKSKSFRYATNF